MPSRIARTTSSEDRCASVSSMRSTNTPPRRFANSQLKIAVRAPPTWRNPVGLGANRTRTLTRVSSAAAGFLDLRPRVFERDRPVEHRGGGRRIRVHAKVAQALELHGGPR